MSDDSPHQYEFVFPIDHEAELSRILTEEIKKEIYREQMKLLYDFLEIKGKKDGNDEEQQK